MESPALANSSQNVRFVPLGGLGEIGMNCFALEQDGKLLVVDCGVTFPDDDVGVDVLHPDFSWLVERRRDISGIFITHGHEDHIGALPFLLGSLGQPVEVFAPTHACALLATRLDERGLDPGVLRQVTPRNVYPVGPFEVEPVTVAHSIIDATALAIRSASGLIFHTGDFDFDVDSPAGGETDEERLLELGIEGVRLLLSDSTNVDRERRESSEARVADALARVIEGATERVVVAMFSSNVPRVLAVARVAERAGRKLCLLGRSLTRHVETARAISRLPFPSSLLVHPDQIRDIPRSELLVLAGGSQAEAPSSLRRLSLGKHPKLSLEAGDTVVLSSRIIPGNEKPVYRMQDDLLRLGVHLHNQLSDPDIHTSGHASRSEQRHMLELIQPEAFIPVHGTLRHLLAHAELAQACGVTDRLVVENGTVVAIPPQGTLKVVGHAPHGVVRRALGGELLDEETRRRRVELGRSGVVFVALVLSSRGEICAPVAVRTLGVPGLDENDRALALVASDVRAFVSRTRPPFDVEEVVRRAVRRAVFEHSGIRPLVEVAVSRPRDASG